MTTEIHEYFKDKISSTMHNIVCYARNMQQSFMEGKSDVSGVDLAVDLLQQGYITTSTFIQIYKAITNPETDFEIKII